MILDEDCNFEVTEACNVIAHCDLAMSYENT